MCKFFLYFFDNNNSVCPFFLCNSYKHCLFCFQSCIICIQCRIFFVCFPISYMSNILHINCCSHDIGYHEVFNIFYSLNGTIYGECVYNIICAIFPSYRTNIIFVDNIVYLHNINPLFFDCIRIKFYSYII